MDNMEKRPAYSSSYWLEEENQAGTFPPVQEDLETEIVIAGGGLTGITTGYLLAQKGHKVIILEARELFSGTTGYTTAKVTAQHGLIYDELISHIGLEGARKFYEASNQALNFISTYCSSQSEKYDFSFQGASVFATNDDEQRQIELEQKAYEKLDIPFEIASGLSFDATAKTVLTMKQQAQFHPIKYLKALLEEFIQLGGKVFEHSPAVSVEEGSQMKVVTATGRKITCQKLVVGSHFPFIDKKGAYFSRLQPQRSYLIAVEPQNEFEGGMYITAGNPVRSIRQAAGQDSFIMLIGGEGHVTGRESNTLSNYLALEAYADEAFGIKQYLNRWSAQDLITLDKVPYIGPINQSSPNIFVATGYRKWGMTNGTAAALLLSDLIEEKDNPYIDLFTPSRFKADPSVKQAFAANMEVAGELIKGKLEPADKTLDEMENDEGAIVKVNGQKTGVYKDPQGQFHAVDPTCTHMGCECNWNDGERTWDCPCHGSRFSYTGEVIEGPAFMSLESITIDQTE
ncbi:FAD-dependent oxidoreductase [Jeotgalibacillus sp. R-1-5s-1]|nr:FAD-dependent oxidoreductase [Jeotgalibacillus sp. R-1-5s-1]